MGGFAAFTHYAVPRHAGRLVVRLSREAWRGGSPPGHVEIKIGPLVVKDDQPTIGKPAVSRSWTIRSGTAGRFVLPTPKSPYRLEIHVDPTFSPAQFGRPDTRQLGAQVELRMLDARN
jgi:hypothetical protein